MLDRVFPGDVLAPEEIEEFLRGYAECPKGRRELRIAAENLWRIARQHRLAAEYYRARKQWAGSARHSDLYDSAMAARAAIFQSLRQWRTY